MKCRSLKHSGSKCKKKLGDTRARIEPYDAKSSAASRGRAPSHLPILRLTIGHTNLPQQPQYSGISAHKYDPQAKHEQLKLSKADPSTWP
jgi:hypothetical protein